MGRLYDLIHDAQSTVQDDNRGSVLTELTLRSSTPDLIEATYSIEIQAYFDRVSGGLMELSLGIYDVQNSHIIEEQEMRSLVTHVRTPSMLVLRGYESDMEMGRTDLLDITFLDAGYLTMGYLDTKGRESAIDHEYLARLFGLGMKEEGNAESYGFGEIPYRQVPDAMEMLLEGGFSSDTSIWGKEGAWVGISGTYLRSDDAEGPTIINSFTMGDKSDTGMLRRDGLDRESVDRLEERAACYRGLPVSTTPYAIDSYSVCRPGPFERVLKGVFFPRRRPGEE